MESLTKQEMGDALEAYLNKRYDTCAYIRHLEDTSSTQSKLLKPGRHLVINTGVFEREQGFVELDEEFCSRMSSPSKYFDRHKRAWFVGQYYIGEYKNVFSFSIRCSPYFIGEDAPYAAEALARKCRAFGYIEALKQEGLYEDFVNNVNTVINDCSKVNTVIYNYYA